MSPNGFTDTLNNMWGGDCLEAPHNIVLGCKSTLAQDITLQNYPCKLKENHCNTVPPVPNSQR